MLDDLDKLNEFGASPTRVLPNENRAYQPDGWPDSHVSQPHDSEEPGDSKAEHLSCPPLRTRLATCAGELLRADRRSFLKDLALLGLCGFTIYDRRKQHGEPIAATASSLSEAHGITVSDDILEDLASSAPALLLPLAGFSLRTLPASRLPNAPRAYRQGRHEGIDLYTSYGTPVLAVADGMVTRADGHYAELDPRLHGRYLDESRELETTPPDILDHLRGRVIEIDHGLQNGVRWRSVYGHLGEVLVRAGMPVLTGEEIGKAGNSGTTAGVRGTREDAHLHLEIRYQRGGSPERYLGQGLTEREVRRLLGEIFHA